MRQIGETMDADRTIQISESVLESLIEDGEAFAEGKRERIIKLEVTKR